MTTRRFGRLGWEVSEVGFGMWQVGQQWGRTDDDESLRALQAAVDGGCNFFDTAFAYGDGHSERLLGRLLRANPGKRLYTASKLAPKNRKWPARDIYLLDDVYPADYIRAAIETTLRNLGTDAIDLMQFHVWTDAWAADERWQRAMDDARREGLIRGVGISVNRWEPANVLRALASGVVDAVQVVYNVFDQNPEDDLYPACRARGVAVIARVPFDEGSLCGGLTRETRFADDDWRRLYFNPKNLAATVERVERLRPAVPAGMTMAELALRFVLSCRDVATVIPGMRKTAHVAANLAAGDGRGLPPGAIAALRAHRWERTPASYWDES